MSRSDRAPRMRQYISFLTTRLEKIAQKSWNDPYMLEEIHYELQFRTRQRARKLREKTSQRLAVLQAQESQSGKIFEHKQGFLSYCGYHVGIMGVPKRRRRQILKRVFLHSTFDKIRYQNLDSRPCYQRDGV